MSNCSCKKLEHKLVEGDNQLQRSQEQSKEVQERSEVVKEELGRARKALEGKNDELDELPRGCGVTADCLR